MTAGRRRRARWRSAARAGGLHHGRGQQSARAGAKVESTRRALVSRHTQLARNAFTKQDLDGAIQNWDQVLSYDANNETARFERKKAIDLKEKLKAIK